MSDALIGMTAREAVARLAARDITPVEPIDAAAARIAAVEPAANALPTLCLDRARDHAKALMRGERREAEGEAGWLAGLPLAIKDLTDGARCSRSRAVPRCHGGVGCGGSAHL